MKIVWVCVESSEKQMIGFVYIAHGSRNSHTLNAYIMNGIHDDFYMKWNGMNERRTASWTIWKWKTNKRREADQECERGSRSTMENWMNGKNIMNIRKE